MSAIDMTLEIELGITGGEEDGVDNTDADQRDLYTKPEEVAYAYEQFMEVSDRFTIAAAFGNVHGVYKPGNVKLRPTILRDSQEYIAEKFGTGPKPVDFVFHGGSGLEPEEIAEAISYGVVKMNIDTDLQWAFWDGIRELQGREPRLPAGPDRQPRGPRQAEQEAVRPARVAARRRGVLRRAPQAGLRRAEQRRHARLTRLYSPSRRLAGPLQRQARMTRPVRSLGVKNVDFGGISRPSRAVRSISAMLTGRISTAAVAAPGADRGERPRRGRAGR